MVYCCATNFVSTSFLRPIWDCVALSPPLSFGNEVFSVMGGSKGRGLGLLATNKREPSVMAYLNRSNNQTTSLQTHQAFWEDPDDGSGSEFQEEEEEESEDGDGDEDEDESDVESDMEKEGGRDDLETTMDGNQLATNHYEEELVSEVEQLLTPEERAVLEQNTAPDLQKLSTAKWKPLQTLALAGQIPFMDKLLVNGLDIDSVDQDGRTALHKAIIGKKEASISRLVRKKANLNVKDQYGATPLHYAVEASAVQTVKLLIKYNVDLNVEDNDGWTPLHIAVQSRNRNITKLLLINGADKTRRNKDGKTALDLSLCYGKDFKSYDLAKLLKILPSDRGL